MKPTRLLDPRFEYVSGDHTDIRTTFRKAQAEIREVRIVKLPPLKYGRPAGHAPKQAKG